MRNYRFIELRCNPDGSYAVIAKTPDRRLVGIEAPPPPCLDPESRAELCDGQIPICEPYLPPSEIQTEQGIVAYGCKNYEECVNAWVKVETLRVPAKASQGGKRLGFGTL
ncbi:MAG: hypothetical protein C4570_07225 [Ammonifex sp.]|nr:MAG: hypothetical protein C4570_07225 [Ammonifex sp.]